MHVEYRGSHDMGVLSEPNLQALLETRDYRTTRYLYPPGTPSRDHAHRVKEIDAVLNGSAKDKEVGSISRDRSR